MFDQPQEGRKEETGQQQQQQKWDKQKTNGKTVDLNPTMLVVILNASELNAPIKRFSHYIFFKRVRPNYIAIFKTLNINIQFVSKGQKKIPNANNK